MENLNQIADHARQNFDLRTAARDKALAQARQLTRFSANTIRSLHRSDFEQAHTLLDEAKTLLDALKSGLADYPDLYFAGYTQDSIKEYCEASIVRALIEGGNLPTPEELGVEYAVYLNGLAEAAGELRRRCLDILRRGYSIEAERMLSDMDDIYDLLVTLDYPDAITNGLRRQTDIVRSILERTRADLTFSLRSDQLQREIEKVTTRFSPE